MYVGVLRNLYTILSEKFLFQNVTSRKHIFLLNYLQICDDVLSNCDNPKQSYWSEPPWTHWSEPMHA